MAPRIEWLDDEDKSGRTPAPPSRPAAPAGGGSPAAADVANRGGLLSKIDAAVRGAADVMTFGLADEFAAKMGALTGIGGEQGQYDKNLQRQRDVDRFDTDTMPYSRGAGQLAGGVTTALALPSLAAKYGGATLAPRVLAGAAEGAGYGVGYGFGSGEGGIENRAISAAKDAGVGALAGGAVAAVAPAVSSGVNRLLGRAAPQTDDMARQQVAAALGVDPATVPQPLVDQFTQAARRSTSEVPAAARAVAADEFGIPLTRGQATGSVPKQAFEEAARNEARGPLAGGVLRRFDERQAGAVDAAAEGFARRAAGAADDAALGTRNPLNLVEDVPNALKAARDKSWQGVNSAYDAAKASDTFVTREAVEAAPAMVRQHLNDAQFIINDATPYARAALDKIDQMAGLGGALDNAAAGATPKNVVGVALAGVEKQREAINLMMKNAAPGTADYSAMQGVKRAFDNWTEDTVSRGLLSGSPEGLELFKQARAARAEHGRVFQSSPRQADADAGKIIETMLTKDVQPVEVANAILGASRVGEKGVSVRLAKRLETALGKDSEAFNSIRQAAWEKLIHNDRGDRLGPQAMASALRRFTDGGGGELAKTLFPADEIGKMRRFAGVLQNIVPDPKATNTSKTGYEISRLMDDYGLRSILGGMGEIITQTPGISQALRGVRDGYRGARARGAVKGGAALAQPGKDLAAGRALRTGVPGAIGMESDDRRAREEAQPLVINVRPRRAN